jgi:hypothetical protein
MGFDFAGRAATQLRSLGYSVEDANVAVDEHDSSQLVLRGRLVREHRCSPAAMLDLLRRLPYRDDLERWQAGEP